MSRAWAYALRPPPPGQFSRPEKSDGGESSMAAQQPCLSTAATHTGLGLTQMSTIPKEMGEPKACSEGHLHTHLPEPRAGQPSSWELGSHPT